MDRIEERFQITLHEGEFAMPRDELLKAVGGKVGAVTLLTDKVDDEFLDAAGPQLVIVANYAVGFDNIDVAACTQRGVMTSNTPEVSDSWTKAYRLPRAEVRSFLPMTMPARRKRVAPPAASAAGRSTQRRMPARSRLRPYGSSGWLDK